MPWWHFAPSLDRTCEASASGVESISGWSIIPPWVVLRALRTGGIFMAEAMLEQAVEVDVAEKVFGNAPNMLVLCLTVIGLIKIYTRFDKVTTLADNFLAFIALGYLVATLVSYLALRSRNEAPRTQLARAADMAFLISLVCTAAEALFITFALAG